MEKVEHKTLKNYPAYVEEIDGVYYVRPLPYRHFIKRLRMAWDVLTQRATATYWDNTPKKTNNPHHDNK